MSSLGIYFGSGVISVVEVQGRKVLNSIRINRLSQSIGELGEKVPEEIKIVAILKEELRKNKISAKEAGVAVSGKDVIIRNFEMPLLPREELEGAVNFEVKKYIPFKVEDLVSVFQARADKASRQNLILFAGIKKEALDKYISIFSQLEIKANVLEYAPFSTLRFLQLAGLRYKGIICVVSVDMEEENETNFLVLENGFPLFCRDITLLGGPEGIPLREEGMAKGAMIEKLKSEIRVSLDYYNRKFPLKKIEKVFFVSAGGYRPDLEGFSKDIGLGAQFIDAAKYIGKSIGPLPAFIKGYGSALFKAVKTDFRVDLLAAKVTPRQAKEKKAILEIGPLLAGLKVSPTALASGAALCVFVFLFFFIYRIQPLERDIRDIISRRPRLSIVKPQAGYEQLVSTENLYKAKVDAAGRLIKRGFYATELLDTLPRIIPDGMWLTSFFLRDVQGGKEVVLDGMAYLADNTKELRLVNDFVSTLKSSQVFSRNFKDIALSSLDTRKEDDRVATRFTISCRFSKEKR